MAPIPVQDLMNRQIPTVLEDASLSDAGIALLEHDSAEVYVVNRGGLLKGIIPEYEVLKARLCGHRDDHPIAAFVTSTVQTVSATASAVAIAGLFREAFRSSMAVVDDKGRLVGQIKRRELIWLLSTLDRIESTEEAGSQLQPEPSAPGDKNPVPEPNFLRKRRILGEQIRSNSGNQPRQ